MVRSARQMTPGPRQLQAMRELDLPPVAAKDAEAVVHPVDAVDSTGFSAL
jgi:hypothetical protein